MTSSGIISNFDVAIYSKVNELSYRFGLRASDMMVLLRDTDGERPWLNFEISSEDPAKAEKIARMMRLLGVGSNDRLAANNYEQLEDALDAALRRAPSPSPWWKR